jgi:hypothetical protein
MKWFWPISCDNTVADPLVADSADLRGFEDLALRVGAAVEGWDASAYVRATDPENDGDPDDVLQTSLGVPIFSNGLRGKLDEVGIKGIQYLPIRVIRPNHEEIGGSPLRTC